MVGKADKDISLVDKEVSPKPREDSALDEGTPLPSRVTSLPAEQPPFTIIHQKRGFWFFAHVAMVLAGPFVIGGSFGVVLGVNSLLWVWLLGRTLHVPISYPANARTGDSPAVFVKDISSRGIFQKMPSWSSDLARGDAGIEMSNGRYVGWVNDDNNKSYSDTDSTSVNTSIDL